VGNSVQQHRSLITLQDNVLGSRKAVSTIRVEHMRSEGGACVLLLLLQARHLEQRRLKLWLENNLICVARSRELVAAAIRGLKAPRATGGWTFGALEFRSRVCDFQTKNVALAVSKI
jgi:hypothetical protein